MKEKENISTYDSDGNLYHENKPKGHDYINSKHGELQFYQAPKKMKRDLRY